MEPRVREVARDASVVERRLEQRALDRRPVGAVVAGAVVLGERVRARAHPLALVLHGQDLAELDRRLPVDPLLDQEREAIPRTWIDEEVDVPLEDVGDGEDERGIATRLDHRLVEAAGDLAPEEPHVAVERPLDRLGPEPLTGRRHPDAGAAVGPEEDLGELPRLVASHRDRDPDPERAHGVDGFDRTGDLDRDPRLDAEVAKRHVEGRPPGQGLGGVGDHRIDLAGRRRGGLRWLGAGLGGRGLVLVVARVAGEPGHQGQDGDQEPASTHRGRLL